MSGPLFFVEAAESLNLSDRFLLDLQEIFGLLDSDNDGVISSAKIELLRLDPRILGIIQEILIEMDEKSEILRFGDFMAKIEKFRLEVRLHEFLREKDAKNTTFSPKHSSVGFLKGLVFNAFF